MGKRTEELLKGRSPNDKKTHEEMLKTPDHKGSIIQNQLRFHFTPVRMATIKNTNNNKC
jgi:hypothetical protein